MQGECNGDTNQSKNDYTEIQHKAETAPIMVSSISDNIMEKRPHGASLQPVFTTSSPCHLLVKNLDPHSIQETKPIPHMHFVFQHDKSTYYVKCACYVEVNKPTRKVGEMVCEADFKVTHQNIKKNIKDSSLQAYNYHDDSATTPRPPIKGEFFTKLCLELTALDGSTVTTNYVYQIGKSHHWWIFALAESTHFVLKCMTEEEKNWMEKMCRETENTNPGLTITPEIKQSPVHPKIINQAVQYQTIHRDLQLVFESKSHMTVNSNDVNQNNTACSVSCSFCTVPTRWSGCTSSFDVDFQFALRCITHGRTWKRKQAVSFTVGDRTALCVFNYDQRTYFVPHISEFGNPPPGTVVTAEVSVENVVAKTYFYYEIGEKYDYPRIRKVNELDTIEEKTESKQPSKKTHKPTSPPNSPIKKRKREHNTNQRSSLKRRRHRENEEEDLCEIVIDSDDETPNFVCSVANSTLDHDNNNPSCGPDNAYMEVIPATQSKAKNKLKEKGKEIELEKGKKRKRKETERDQVEKEASFSGPKPLIFVNESKTTLPPCNQLLSQQPLPSIGNVVPHQLPTSLPYLDLSHPLSQHVSPVEVGRFPVHPSTGALLSSHHLQHHFQPLKTKAKPLSFRPTNVEQYSKSNSTETSTEEGQSTSKTKRNKFGEKLKQVLDKDRPNETGVQRLLIQDQKNGRVWYYAVSIVDKDKAGQSLKVYEQAMASSFPKLLPKQGYIKVSQTTGIRLKFGNLFGVEGSFESYLKSCGKSSSDDIQIYYLEASPMLLKGTKYVDLEAVTEAFGGIEKFFGTDKNVQLENILNFLELSRGDQYFHGCITRQQAEQILEDKVLGLSADSTDGYNFRKKNFVFFLVRLSRSQSFSGSFVISHTKVTGGVTHFLISSDFSEDGELNFNHNLQGVIFPHKDFGKLLATYFTILGTPGKAVKSEKFKKLELQELTPSPHNHSILRDNDFFGTLKDVPQTPQSNPHPSVASSPSPASKSPIIWLVDDREMNELAMIEIDPKTVTVQELKQKVCLAFEKEEGSVASLHTIDKMRVSTPAALSYLIKQSHQHTEQQKLVVRWNNEPAKQLPTPTTLKADSIADIAHTTHPTVITWQRP